MSSDVDNLLKRLKKAELDSDQIAGLYDFAAEKYDEDIRSLVPQPPIDLVTMETDFIPAMQERSLGNVITGLASGYSRFDKMTRGFEKNDLMVIAGGPARGKTLLIHSVMHTMAVEGVKCLFISLEMSPRKIIQRTLDMHEGTGDSLENTQLLPIYFYPKNASRSPKDLRHYIQEVVRTEGIQMVVLDHLGMLPDLATEVRHSYKAWMKHFRDWCEEFNISFTLLVHINKLDDNQEPQERDIAESQTIANFADKIVLVWRDKDNSDPNIRNVVKTKLTKNRHHDDMGKIYFRINQYFKLEELTSVEQSMMDSKVAKAAKSVFGGGKDDE